jgi:hypothetical protein
VSLVFLVVALYRANYLVVPQILSIPALLASLLLLFGSLILHALCWREILRHSGYEVKTDDCVAGTGLSVFGKYIPGKIWPVVGRAAYIAQRSQYRVGELSAMSLNAEFVLHWMGLIFGTIGLLVIGGFHAWGILTLCLWAVLTVVIFNSFFHSTAERVVNKLLKKNIRIPSLTLRSVISVIPWFFMHWAVLLLGYNLFVLSLTGGSVPWNAGFGYALAKTLGVMAVIVPGGIGVREGVLVGYLTMAGYTLPEATTISIVSRLWALAGEIFIFLVGAVLSRHRMRGQLVQ